MGAVTLPLRRVVKSDPRPNYRLDTLECGHIVADYEPGRRAVLEFLERPVQRRRCKECGSK